MKNKNRLFYDKKLQKGFEAIFKPYTKKEIKEKIKKMEEKHDKSKRIQDK